MPRHYQLRYKCKAMYVYNGLHVYLVKVASNLFTFYLSFLLYYLNLVNDSTVTVHKYLDIYSNLNVYKLYSILYYHMTSYNYKI